MRSIRALATWVAAASLLASPGLALDGPRKAQSSLSPTLGKGSKVPEAAFGNLVVTVDPEQLVEENLEAAATLYAAAALEEMKFFEVADRVADHFVKRMLPVGEGAESTAYSYVKKRPQRMDANERRRMYGHVFGGTDSSTPATNQDFEPLFGRLLAAVSEFERQSTPAKATKPPASAEGVHAAARALAANLSNRTYGAPIVAAALLSEQIRDAELLLSQPQILEAYQARDLWQVVERVAKQELGGSPSVARYRSLAESGSAVIGWLGQVTSPLASSCGAPQLASSLAASRVPAAARTLNRSVSPKHELASKPASGGSAKVYALCFDKQRRLVACQVKLK